mmetsp:Transcript_35417/g.85370  ORF Transcript_35417/g.85370 Transcript_35417/m.85370 type:complete len:81 (-) Transcript_35417:39-281(-)
MIKRLAKLLEENDSDSETADSEEQRALQVLQRKRAKKLGLGETVEPKKTVAAKKKAGPRPGCRFGQHGGFDHQRRGHLGL